jgi:hypothetical protein
VIYNLLKGGKRNILMFVVFINVSQFLIFKRIVVNKSNCLCKMEDPLIPSLNNIFIKINIGRF